MNSELPFSLVKEPNLPFSLITALWRIVALISFPRVLALCEMQITSSQIWTRVFVSISYDGNYYIPSTSKIYKLISPYDKVLRYVLVYRCNKKWDSLWSVDITSTISYGHKTMIKNFLEDHNTHWFIPNIKWLCLITAYLEEFVSQIGLNRHLNWPFKIQKLSFHR